jgi:hypothetical protein
MIERDCSQHGYFLPNLFHFFPSVGSKLSAEPKSFFSILSFSCGYLNKACFGTRELRIFGYRRLE